MVEPKRKYIDIESVWKKQLLKKASGPGGLLIMTVVQARDLRYIGQGYEHHVCRGQATHSCASTMLADYFPTQNLCYRQQSLSCWVA